MSSLEARRSFRMAATITGRSAASVSRSSSEIRTWYDPSMSFSEGRAMITWDCASTSSMSRRARA